MGSGIPCRYDCVFNEDKADEDDSFRFRSGRCGRAPVGGGRALGIRRRLWAEKPLPDLEGVGGTEGPVPFIRDVFDHG